MQRVCMLGGCRGERSITAILSSIILPLLLLVVLVVSVRNDKNQSSNYRIRFTPNNQDSNDGGATLEPEAAVDPSSSFTYRIMQLTDLHLGENAWEDWGPRADNRTFAALDRYFQLLSTNCSTVVSNSSSGNRTCGVDLVVLSGDQLTANNVDANATAYYRRLADFLQARQVKFATIFGNHDDAPMESTSDGNLEDPPHSPKTSRRQLQQLLDSYPNSVSEQGPADLPGVSNYWLNVTNPQNDHALVFRLAFVDTGGGAIPSQITNAQMDWFRQQVQESSDTPIAVFQHIPTKEFQTSTMTSNSTCTGLHEDGLMPVYTDPGWVDLLRQSPEVQFLAAGHQHGNDYCCQIYGEDGSTLSLCYGRHSGYGGYGSWDRGARVYEFRFSGDYHSMDWESWVLMESGDVLDRFRPSK